MSNKNYETIKIKDILNKDTSLAAITYSSKSTHKGKFIKLNELMSSYEKGYEPGSSNYVSQSKYNFIRISDLSDYDLTFDLNNKIQKIRPPSSQQPLAKKGDILYQTASNVGNVCVYNDKIPSYYNSHLIKLNLIKDKFYVLGFLKSTTSKDQLSIAGSIRGVDNFRLQYLTNMNIIYPTEENYSKPKRLIEYISDVVKNLIHKEEEIKLKSLQIDKLIETELKKNFNSKEYKYKSPKINEIIEGNRIDSTIFTENYKKIDEMIKTYPHGYYYISEKNVFPGYTPKDHIYSNVDSKKNYLWITPKNIEGRTLSYKTFISTKKHTRVKRNDIVISGIRYVGNGYYISSDDKTYANQNTLIIRNHVSKIDQIFLFCFLTSKTGREMLLRRRVMGTVPILYKEQLAKIGIPNFNDKLKKEISDLYFQDVEFDNSSAEEYLVYEKERNKKLGIHQLNNEIMRLRNLINELFLEIALGNKINIKYDYHISP